MTLIFPHISRRKSAGKLEMAESEPNKDEKASSICMSFGCGIFFLICAMIGYFYMKAFEMNGMILPNLLKVRYFFNLNLNHCG
jgi:hypothetical protein